MAPACVRLLDFQDDPHEALDACDCIAAIGRAEGAGMPVIEGIAHALPVIAAAGGGGSELVEHAVTGYFVDIEEGASLDAALMALVADGELRTRMGASGFQRYSQNSVASHAASFLKWAALF